MERQQENGEQNEQPRRDVYQTGKRMFSLLKLQQTRHDVAVDGVYIQPLVSTAVTISSSDAWVAKKSPFNFGWMLRGLTCNHLPPPTPQTFENLGVSLWMSVVSVLKEDVGDESFGRVLLYMHIINEKRRGICSGNQ